uniref:Acetyltransferase peniE n=1 Tax=Penicillium patulum TaxID=5078 RepID=PENIE_PENPA|nr:PeniE [Penicillium griseofulvum]
MSAEYTCRSTNPWADSSTIYAGLVVNAVLDLDILHEKQKELISLWPILGGTVVQSTKPWSFTCGSNVDFESRTLDETVSTHFPNNWGNMTGPSASTTLDPAIVDAKFLFAIKPAPSTIFRIRVTVLRDATLVCFGITHQVTGAGGCFEVVSAFCDLLANRAIPHFALPPDARGLKLSDHITGGDDNVTSDELGDFEPPEKNWNIGVVKAATMMWRVLIAQFWKTLGLREKLTEKYIHLPGDWVDEVRNQAQKELSSLPESSDVELTRNDIISAWYLKTIHGPSSSSGCDTTPVDFYVAINYKGLLNPNTTGGCSEKGPSAEQQQTQYLHHSVAIFRCMFSAYQLQNDSISSIAWRIRRATLHYKQPSSIKKYVRFVEKNNSNLLVVDIRASNPFSMVGLSSWTTYNYMALDFSGAIGDRKAPQDGVRVTFVNPLALSPISGLTLYTLKDGKGGYVIRTANTKTQWKQLEKSSSMENLFPVL